VSARLKKLTPELTPCEAHQTTATTRLVVIILKCKFFYICSCRRNVNCQFSVEHLVLSHLNHIHYTFLTKSCKRFLL
jgi:hypothetical protein